METSFIRNLIRPEADSAQELYNALGFLSSLEGGESDGEIRALVADAISDGWGIMMWRDGHSLVIHVYDEFGADIFIRLVAQSGAPCWRLASAKFETCLGGGREYRVVETVGDDVHLVEVFKISLPEKVESVRYVLEEEAV